MSIKNELQNELVDSLRAQDRNRADVVRQITTEVARAMKAPGFEGDEDDALYQKTIGNYAKKMTKALADYDRLGQSDSDPAAKLRFEVDYLGRWLPKALSEEEIVALVDEAVQAVGAMDMKGMGQVMGHLKKGHPDLDGAIASRLVKARLSGG